MLIILRSLQDAVDPDNGLIVDTFGPQKHVLGYGFTFSQHTLDCSDVLTKDQEEDMFAHRSSVVNPCFKDNPSAGVLARKLCNPL